MAANASVDQVRVLLGHCRMPSPDTLEDIVRIAAAGKCLLPAGTGGNRTDPWRRHCEPVQRLEPGAMVLGGVFGQELSGDRA